jgi:hypothetical protein
MVAAMLSAIPTVHLLRDRINIASSSGKRLQADSLSVSWYDQRQAQVQRPLPSMQGAHHESGGFVQMADTYNLRNLLNERTQAVSHFSPVRGRDLLRYRP